MEASETKRLNNQLAVCPYCGKQTTDEPLIAEHNGTIDGKPVQTIIQAVKCEDCGYLDAWAETPSDMGFKSKFDSYRSDPEE